MTKRTDKPSRANTVTLLFLGLAGLGLCIAILLRDKNVALFKPAGQVAKQEHSLMLFSVVALLAIAVPTMFLMYYFAWKYRESNEKTAHNPHASHGKLLVVSIWAVPSIFVIVLASVMWPAAHKLAPNQALANDAQPITIQVVAMRWKWLFIYPEQHIATVNFVQVPVGTPVRFELTADEAPMSSFSIPRLGSQLYAMTGHQNQLNLVADTPGDYPGRSAEINGAGFAGMQFVARASSQQDFNSWVQHVKRSTDVLDTTGYEKLLRPSQDNPAAYYSHAQSDLYSKLVIKYIGTHGGHTEHE